MDNDMIVKRFAESQKRLCYLEEQIRMNKKLMVLVTLLAAMTVLLNRQAKVTQ